MENKEIYLSTLLYNSIESRDISSVESLLSEKRADPNKVLPEKGISPFHLAIGWDPTDFALNVVSLILQHGGDPNVRSDDDVTPVHIAASWGRRDILDLLLDHGGDPEALDVDGKTPFHYAARDCFHDCLASLVAHLSHKYEPVCPDSNDDDDDDRYCLILDKIIVDNGIIVGEYSAEEPTPIDHPSPNPIPLQSLPRTEPSEYILNWFEQQKRSVDLDDSLSSDRSSVVYSESSSLAETDRDELEAKRYNAITFRKTYRKTRSKVASGPPSLAPSLPRQSVAGDETTFYESKPYTRESGVRTLERSSLYRPQPSKGKSNNCRTCSEFSVQSFVKNVDEVTDDLGKLSVRSGTADGSSEYCSFVTVSEIYKYIDKEEDVVLYEKRLLNTSSQYAASVRSETHSSRHSSLPPSLDYDPERLRRELEQLGLSPGPITATTKKVYLKKLHQLKKQNNGAIVRPIAPAINQRVYSVELEKTLRSLEWCNNATYGSLEEQLVSDFRRPDPSRKWREGVAKASFNYVLLDPRITNNLPARAANMTDLEVWPTFLSAIFYVGKGIRSRPYQHLYDAVRLWNRNESAANNAKLQRILDIWKSDRGVICLHVFQHAVPVEAYTREAAMIGAIGLKNLTNAKSGDFYGSAATWNQKQKQMLGVYLLYKAMKIFLPEGERQLYAHDIN